jgi:hypothetical protein
MTNANIAEDNATLWNSNWRLSGVMQKRSAKAPEGVFPKRSFLADRAPGTIDAAKNPVQNYFCC